MVNTLTVILSVMLVEILAPANSLLQPFVSIINDSLRVFSISVTLDPVSCNAQLSVDLLVLGFFSCTLFIGSKPQLDGILLKLVDSRCIGLLSGLFSCKSRCAFCHIHLFHLD